MGSLTVLFDLIPYVPVNNFSAMFSVEPVLSKD